MIGWIKNYLLEKNISILENADTLTPQQAQALDNMRGYRKVLAKERNR